MLFAPVRAAEATLRRTPLPLLSRCVPPFLHPSTFSQSLFWPGIWFLFSSFILNPLFFIIHFISFDLIRLLSVNADRSLWLSGVLPPSLYLSLSIAGSVCRSPVSVRLSVRACVCPSRLSVRCFFLYSLVGWGPTACEEGAETLTSCVAGGPESVPVEGCPSL